MPDLSGIALDAILVMASQTMFTILSSMPNRVSGTADFFPLLVDARSVDAYAAVDGRGS